MSEFHPIVPDKLLDRSRKLHEAVRIQNAVLWSYLRGNQLGGLKFRRQFGIGPYIADFYCYEQRLVVELDGASHDDRGQYDLDRDQFLKSQNLRVIRFSNDDVLCDLEAVLKAILVACGIDPHNGEQISRPSP